uniref:Uncharacterized protein n=1 Tax=Echinococcus canadensis TaxID=519352 RepID=A0A915EZ07_9CEST
MTLQHTTPAVSVRSTPTSHDEKTVPIPHILSLRRVKTATRLPNETAAPPRKAHPHRAQPLVGRKRNGNQAATPPTHPRRRDRETASRPNVAHQRRANVEPTPGAQTARHRENLRKVEHQARQKKLGRRANNGKKRGS